MKHYFVVIMIAAFCLIGVAHAQGEKLAPGAHIAQLILYGKLNAETLYVSSYFALSEAPGVRAKALAELDANAMDAIKEANGHEDLIKAVKQYYAAASAFFHNEPPSDPTRLDEQQVRTLASAMDEKAASVRLEANLAGFNIPQIP